VQGADRGGAAAKGEEVVRAAFAGGAPTAAAAHRGGGGASGSSPEAAATGRQAVRDFPYRAPFPALIRARPDWAANEPAAAGQTRQPSRVIFFSLYASCILDSIFQYIYMY